jgi:redox-sensitive bicupin YhaK (pirin superfamily)
MKLTHLPIEPLNIGKGFNADGIRGDDAVLDPYLMADHFWMSQPTFGAHPHAGFSAVTYLFTDSTTSNHSYDTTQPGGNHHTIDPGDAHWFIAASGAIHDEPIVAPGKMLHGLQLFVNLAAADKLGTPRTLHIKRAAMAQHTQPSGATATLAWGRYNDGAHAMRGQPEHTPPTDSSLIDITLPAGSAFHYPLAEGQTALLLTAQGQIQLDGTTLAVHEAVTLGRGGGVLSITATDAAQCVLLLGTPFNEPVARYGPFAMSNREQLQDAMRRYQSGAMGRLA